MAFHRAKEKTQRPIWRPALLQIVTTEVNNSRVLISSEKQLLQSNNVSKSFYPYLNSQNCSKCTKPKRAHMHGCKHLYLHPGL